MNDDDPLKKQQEEKVKERKKPPDPPDPDKQKKEEETDKSKTEPIIFQATDEGPFVVFVESTNRGNGIDRMHPMALGNIFKRLHSEIQNTIERVSKNGKNRLKIVLKDRKSANILATSDKMKEKGFLCYVPKFLVTKQAVIKGVYTDLSEKEILEECEVPYELKHKVKLISVRRFSRRENDKWVPTETVQLTFRAQVLPQYVTIHYVRCRVDPFIPKVLQCAKCLRYGHSLKFCKSVTLRCNTCGEESHSANECTKPPPPRCLHCKGEHPAYVENIKLNKCPEFKKQQEIKKIMATENKTFLEARSSLRQKTYAEVSGSKPTNEQIPNSPLPQTNLSQTNNLFRKRRRDSPPRLDSLQKQREMYNSFNKDTNLPLSPIINQNSQSNQRPNTSYHSQSSSPSLGTQTFVFNEKVRKTNQPNYNKINKSSEENISYLILSVMKTILKSQEALNLPENKLLDIIRNEIKNQPNSNHEFE